MMGTLKDLFQSADWKKEKHAPVIEAPDSVKKSNSLTVALSVGKEIAHPNTTEHHIAWIELYFLPEGEKFPYQVGRFEFSAHGASTQGPNTSTIYTEPVATAQFKTEKSGRLLASSYCNIHGLWESSKDLKVE
jgi:superoxide reductase